MTEHTCLVMRCEGCVGFVDGLFPHNIFCPKPKAAAEQWRQSVLHSDWRRPLFTKLSLKLRVRLSVFFTVFTGGLCLQCLSPISTTMLYSTLLGGRQWINPIVSSLHISKLDAIMNSSHFEWGKQSNKNRANPSSVFFTPVCLYWGCFRFLSTFLFCFLVWNIWIYI